MKMTWLVLLLSLIIFLNAQDNNAYSKVEELLKSGQTEQARQILEQMLDTDNKKADTYYYLGVVNLVKSKPKKAIEYFEEAIELKDTDYRYYENLGDAYGMKAQTGGIFGAMFVLDDMRENWEKAIELKPDLVSSRARLFSFYLMAPGIAGGDDEKALALANEVLNLEPGTGHTLKAGYFNKLEKYEEAEQEYLAAVKIDSSSGQLANQIAYFYLNQKKYKQALSWFNRYVFLSPEQANSYDSRGDYFTAVAQFDSALAMYEKALQLDPQFQSALFNKANSLAQLKREMEARMAAQAYLKKYPEGRYADEAEEIAED